MEARGEVEGPMLKLTMEKGPLAGQGMEFKPGITVRVGRVVRGNNLTIKDSGISSKHLTIEFNSDDGNWVIRDLGSSNGTFLNAVKLDPSQPACLSDCDVVKIGELTSIKVQIDDANRAPIKPRRNAGRKAATGATTNGDGDGGENCELGLVGEDANRAPTKPRRKAGRKAAADATTNDDGGAAENCELGLVGEDANRASTKPRRNPRRKAATDATTNGDGDAGENCELGLVGEDANRASTKPRRNPRRKAATDTTTNDDGDAAENCEFGLVGEELGNNNKGKMRRPPRHCTRANTQSQRDSESVSVSVKAELQPEGIGLENAGLRMTRSSSKTENFDGGASQAETGDFEIVESSSVIETTAQYADENGDQRRTRNARGRGSRELRKLVPIEQPPAKAKRVTRSKKQINLQAESVTTVHLEEEDRAEKMSISKEHTQCKGEAIQSREEERQVEGYNTVEEPVNFGEGQSSVSNTSGAKKDENEVREQTKCQDEAIQTMEEDGQVEGNNTESITTVHLQEEERAEKMSTSKEHTQCEVEAAQVERLVEGYNTVEEPVNLGEGQNSVSNTSGAKKDENEVREQTKCQDEEIQTMEEDGQVEGNNTESITAVHLQEEERAEKLSTSKEHTLCEVEATQVERLVEGQNSVSNTSGAKKDENEVWEQTKCQDEAIQTMDEDGQVEGNHTVEQQLTFEEEACHGLPNLSSGNKGKADVGELNLEILTLGEWLNYLEIYVPKQIIDATEEMISEMRKKAEKLQEFMLHQKNAKENHVEVME